MRECLQWELIPHFCDEKSTCLSTRSQAIATHYHCYISNGFCQIIYNDPSNWGVFAEVFITGDGATPGDLFMKENLMQMVRKVKVTGLKSKPHLNGKEGILFDFDWTKMRCVVRVEKIMISLSCENLIFPKNTVVEINGLQQRPQLNGKIGTIVEIDIVKQRYTVQLSISEKLSVKFVNVIP